MIRIRKILPIAVLSSLLSTSPAAQLIYAVSLIRHGDRTPTRYISSDPLQWRQGLGQLTPLGMRQEYELGKQLRQRLVNHFHLLPASYQRTSINIRSTDVDRTLMSATCLLYGLYPLGSGPRIGKQYALPQGFQPIPIHTVERSSDHLLKHDRHKFNQLIRTKVLTNPSVQKKLKHDDKFLHQVAEAAKVPFHSPKDIYRLAVNIRIRLLYQRPLPKGITPSMLKKIFKFQQWLHFQVFKPQAIGVFISGELLHTIANHIQDAVDHKTKIKYQLYSAHDTNILGVFSALQMPLKDNPPYAAELRFELYKNKTDFYVNSYYNGKLIKFPWCEKHCSLDKFRRTLLSLG